MAKMPDWMIRKACASWPTEWDPAGDPARRQQIPDAGPLVEPFDPELLGPSSVDMRLGLLFESDTPLSGWVVRGSERLGPISGTKTTVGSHYVLDGEAEIASGRSRLGDGVEVQLMPGQWLICVSAEYYRLPPDVLGELYTKSSRAREGITHSTASLIHAGFQGPIAFEITNGGHKPYAVRSGMRVMQIAFEKMEAPAEMPYFALRSAKYRGQGKKLASADPRGAA